MSIKKFIPELQNKSRFFEVGIGAIDLDKQPYLFVDNYVKENSSAITKVKDFINEYKDFVYTECYEGNTIFLFATTPEIIKMKDVDGLHRGATGVVENCPKNALVLMDLD